MDWHLILAKTELSVQPFLIRNRQHPAGFHTYTRNATFCHQRATSANIFGLSLTSRQSSIFRRLNPYRLLRISPRASYFNIPFTVSSSVRMHEWKLDWLTTSDSSSEKNQDAIMKRTCEMFTVQLSTVCLTAIQLLWSDGDLQSDIWYPLLPQNHSICSTQAFL